MFAMPLNENAPPDSKNSEENRSEELVPIYGVCKSYSDKETRADGSQKSKSELGSMRFKHQLAFLTRGDHYSHACVSFNDDLTDMYSYDDEGFVDENIMTDDSWLGTDAIYICVMFVPKSDFDRMHRFVNDLKNHRSEAKYAYSNLLKAYVGKPTKADKRFVCSTFTAFIMQCSNPKNLHRDYSRLRPEDITILPRAFYVMTATDRLDFIKRKSEMRRKVQAMFQQHKDELDDYNNHLPKIMLQDKMEELKTFDKILDWLINKL